MENRSAFSKLKKVYIPALVIVALYFIFQLILNTYSSFFYESSGRGEGGLLRLLGVFGHYNLYGYMVNSLYTYLTLLCFFIWEFILEKDKKKMWYFIALSLAFYIPLEFVIYILNHTNQFRVPDPASFLFSFLNYTGVCIIIRAILKKNYKNILILFLIGCTISGMGSWGVNETLSFVSRYANYFIGETLFVHMISKIIMQGLGYFIQIYVLFYFIYYFERHNFREIFTSYNNPTRIENLSSSEFGLHFCVLYTFFLTLFYGIGLYLMGTFSQLFQSAPIFYLFSVSCILLIWLITGLHLFALAAKWLYQNQRTAVWNYWLLFIPVINFFILPWLVNKSANKKHRLRLQQNAFYRNGYEYKQQNSFRVTILILQALIRLIFCMVIIKTGISSWMSFILIILSCIEWVLFAFFSSNKKILFYLMFTSLVSCFLYFSLRFVGGTEALWQFLITCMGYLFLFRAFHPIPLELDRDIYDQNAKE